MLSPALLALALLSSSAGEPPPLPEPTEIVEHGDGPLYYRELPPRLGFVDRFGVGLLLSPRTGDALTAGLLVHTSVGGIYELRRGSPWAFLGEIGFSYASVPELLGGVGFGAVLGGLGPGSGTDGEPGAISLALEPRLMFGWWRRQGAIGFGVSAIAAWGPVGLELGYQRISASGRTVGELQLGFTTTFGFPGEDL